MKFSSVKSNIQRVVTVLLLSMPFTSSIASTKETVVTTPMLSIKPLAMIYAALTPDTVLPSVFLSSRKNLHDYQLSVADIRLLQQQPVFYWMGPEREVYLAKVAPRFSATATWYRLNSKTSHSWLNRQGLLSLADQMAVLLKAEFNSQPDKIAIIDAKLKQFGQALDQRYGYWQQQFKAFHEQPFLLGHSAFVEFAKDMGLDQAEVYRSGHNHGHAAAGMHELVHIQQEISKKEIYCAIQEPDVNFKQLQKRYPYLTLVDLEPMADSIPLSATAYIEFIDASAAALLQCLN